MPGRLCAATAAARRAREARAFAAAMPSDWADCGRQRTSSTPRCMASSNHRLGWSSVRATIARPVRVGERGAQLRGQAVAVGREVPDEHLGRRLDDSTIPERSKRSRIEDSSAWSATRMRSGCIGRAPVTSRGRRCGGTLRGARRAGASPRWRRGCRRARSRSSSSRRRGRCRPSARAFARYDTWRSVRRSSIEPWAVESPVWAAAAGVTSSTSAPAARTYVSTWFVSST